jgi:alkylation response protein AidB-like acyl-CoA dehydrogenase
MYEYRAPRRDFQFVLHEVLEAERVLKELGRAEVNRELIDGIIDEAARFTETVLSPINWQGDWQGPELKDGQVRVPAAFRAAYQQFCRDGWAGMAAAPEYGGQGLPALASIAVGEMLCGSAMAWRMASGLSEGGVLAITRHGSEALKAQYLGKLVSGEWTCTMCLTEPQAGTDLGILRTRAEPAADGSFRLNGTKIFISWGDHDMADNIVHLVLARLPDAVAGTRGLSLFLVPKLRGGAPNGVSCASIEHKMGIHGSPTCVLNFEDASGWLVGNPGGGLACMFTMMNHARLGVGLQGLGLSERALQAGVRYVFERRQGRSARGPVAKGEPADPIIVHPDVRRMVLTQKALTEGQRLLAYYTYLLEDVERLAPDAAERERAAALVALLVPIVKSLLTDTAMETTSLAVQIHGGSGFIRETGAEQYLRDAKIACIYEGTNGIQALDLLGRKVLHTGGASLKLLADEIIRTLAAPLPAACVPWAAAIKAGLEEWATLTREIGGRAARDPDELGAAAVDYLNFAGYLLVGWCWLRMALVAQAKLDAGSGDQEFYQGKLAAARLYFERLLPRTRAFAAAARAGAASLPTLAPAHFGA